MELNAAAAAFAESLPTGLDDEHRLGRLSAYRQGYLDALVLAERRIMQLEEFIATNIAQLLELEPQVVVRLLGTVIDIAGAEADYISTLPTGLDAVERGLAYRAGYAESIANRLPVESILDLSDALVGAQSSLAEPAMKDLVDFVQIATGDAEPDEVEPAIYNNARWLLNRLDRLARILRGLTITRREIDAIAETQSDNGFLDFNQIRWLEPADSGVDLFDSWLALIKAKQVQRLLPRADQDLFDFLIYEPESEPPEVELFSYLSLYTGWNKDPKTGDDVNNIEALARGLGFIVRLPSGDDAFDIGAFRQFETYRKLHQAVTWLRRWRIPVEQLVTWSDPTSPTADLAQSLEQTARDRYPDDERWYEVLTPMMDELREKKRDALLAFLINREENFSSTNHVYERYLIDPEMGSCMLTSRIKQANAAIQLFVQRILMNLEDNVRLAEGSRGARAWHDHWRQWEWMKNYRVWEANHKVFLYPENWIFPELRDDMSPFFRELINELLQDEINETTIERAYGNYLEKLDLVSQLDIRGLYRDQEQDGKDTLHVFARTRSAPHIYFYRRRNLITKVWTAWEKVNLNIEGNHLIPVVHYGRLLLFWAAFEEKDSYWGINIFWSEYKQGKWLATRSSNSRPLLQLELRDLDRNTEVTGEGIPVSGFLFRSSGQSDKLRIDLFTSYRVTSEDGPWKAKQSKYLSVLMPRYSLATFVFNECTQQLEVDGSVDHVRFLKFPHEAASEINSRDYLKSLYNNLEAQNQYLSLLTKISGDDEIRFERLPEIYRLNEREQRLIISMNDLILAGIFNGVHRRLSTDTRFTITSPIEPFNNKIEAYNLLPDHQERQFTAKHPFIFTRDSQPYLVTATRRWKETPSAWIGGPPTVDKSVVYTRFLFEPLFHPFLCNILTQFYRKGIDGLHRPPAGEDFDRQLVPSRASPLNEYGPVEGVTTVIDPEDIDFYPEGAYAGYNWELFFHMPLLVATRLSENQRFEEAQRWFHYIFDPTDISNHPDPARFWRVRPFFELANEPPQTTYDLLRLIAAKNEDAVEQVEAWRDDPFNPHLIARLRIVAYMKTTVMKYLDNLIAWGDHLFQMDTMESINEATQLYMLAAEILGPKQVTVAEIKLPPFTYAEITAGGARLDELSNAWLELEDLVPVDLGLLATTPSRETPPLLPYFCIPSNDKLLSYWDTVADRLFKIRHCMNIEGLVRQLRLYEPPIDPALLVRARAAGLDLSTVLGRFGDIDLPHYRYATMRQIALDFCNEVRSLGNTLLSALEKRDAEDLALRRSSLENSLLSLASAIKEKNVEEAVETHEGLQFAWERAQLQHEYYTTREYMNAAEIISMALLGGAHVFETVGQGYRIAAAGVHLVPQFHAQGVATGTSSGGKQVGDSLSATAESFAMIAKQLIYGANLASTIGGYERRKDDWGQQAKTALKEMYQLDKQIAASRIRHAIAERDRDNHKQQLEQSREVEAFMKDKFTSQELYSWMVGRLAALYYQTYQMAVNLAQKAERAAQFELGLPASEFQFIGFDHWDSLKKGLLAGEQLSLELRRLDAAFTEKNKRQHEIIKHISLAMLNPAELLRLRETGSCQISLSEELFDLDFPGHYNRRIKSVSLSIPCVTGPYTSVSCTLTLGRNQVRFDPRTGEDGYRVENDSRFRGYNGIMNQSITTSSAQNDSGVFELNFRDERYLPFEGAGVISDWHLDLSGKWEETREGSPRIIDLSQFDFNTISDVILHINYTAKDGGLALKQAARTNLVSVLGAPDTPRFQLFGPAPRVSQRVAPLRLWRLHAAPTYTGHYLNPIPFLCPRKDNPY